MTDLKQRLEEAADDTGHPLRTDLGDLLARARRARRRDRVSTVGVAVAATAAVALAAPLAAGTLAGRSDSGSRPVAGASQGAATAATTPAHTPARTTPTRLTSDMIVQRCLPQLSLKSPDLLPRDWELAYPDRTYAVGEVVGIRATRFPDSPPVLCLIPGAGHEREPVPARAFLPRAEQHELITQLCSQITPYSASGTRVDLRGGTVVAAASSDGRVAAVVNRSGSSYACTLEGLAERWATGSLYPAQTPRRLVDTNVFVAGVAIGVKSKGTPTAYYWGAGRLPEGAAAIVLDFRNRPDRRVDVTNGAYAYVIKQSSAYGLDGWRTKVLTSSGKVMCTSSWSPGGPGYGCLEAR